MHGAVVGLNLVSLQTSPLSSAIIRQQPQLAKTLVRQPLYRLLQRLPGAGQTTALHESFLSDDSWMHSNITDQTIRENGSKIVLRSGIAHALARLAELLKPVRLRWIDEVLAMNPALRQNEPDVEGYLFGRDRIPLERAGDAIKHHVTRPITTDKPPTELERVSESAHRRCLVLLRFAPGDGRKQT